MRDFKAQETCEDDKLRGKNYYQYVTSFFPIMIVLGQYLSLQPFIETTILYLPKPNMTMNLR